MCFPPHNAKIIVHCEAMPRRYSANCVIFNYKSNFSRCRWLQENETFTEFDSGSGIEDVVTDNKSVTFSGDFDDSTGFEIDTEPYSEFETTTVVSDSGFETTSVSDSNLETDKGVNFWEQ